MNGLTVRMVCAGLLLLGAGLAYADDDLVRPAAVDARASALFDVAIARTSTQPSSITVAGFEPGLSLGGAWFGRPWLGVTGDLRLTGFTVRPSEGVTPAPVGLTGLFNVDARLAAAFRWSPVTRFALEGQLGPALLSRAVLVYQGTSSAVTSSRVTQLGVSLGVHADLRLDRWVLSADVVGTPGLAVWVLDTPQSKVTSGWLNLGLSVGVDVMRTRSWALQVLARAELIGSEASNTQKESFNTAELHGLLGARFEFGELPRDVLVNGSPRQARVVGQVRCSDGTPVTQAKLTVGWQAVALEADGRFTAEAPEGAPVELKAERPGYHAAVATVTPAEGLAEVALVLTPMNGPGRIRVSVISAEGQKPVADAEVLLAGTVVGQTDATGVFTITAAGPGPVKVAVHAKGLVDGEEVVSVPPEAEATLALTLAKKGERKVATFKGLIRSATGQPVQATVRIKGLATEVKVKPDGRFSVEVPGGTYTLTISAPGHVTQVKSVDVADGDQALFHTVLQPFGR